MDSKLRYAVENAKQRFNVTGDVYRVFKAYNLYHVRPAKNHYDGEHVAYVTFKAYEDCALTRELT